ncbi:M10 family metallopeptidase C-terminal domain-containing protein [Lutimaribacter marinistellae]|uniref:M10 family metallopeptidase C-terminal domain-containing protein n=1 Tax=Lutimaribacter marinistellae TaxID=1820329 RepID=A0ABV7TNE5_9RHOB
MCNICAEFRPVHADCPYTGKPMPFSKNDLLRQIDELALDIADAEYLFGNEDPPLPIDPFEGVGFPEEDPTAFGPGNDIPGGGFTNIELTTGMRLNAEIGAAGDTDWFRMFLTQGQSYEVSMSALPIDGLGDPLLVLRDDFGNALLNNDNKFQSLDSVLAFTATRTGLYFVEATGFGGGGQTTGAYQIALNAVNYSADTVGDIPNLAAPAQVNMPVIGTVDFVDDIDMYAVELEAGKSYYAVLDAFGDNGNALGDPLIRLRDAGLAVLAENDDNGITRNAFIAFEIETSGTYYFEATGSRSTTGEFRLNIVELAPPPAPDPLKGVDWGVQFDKTHIRYFFADAGESVMQEITDSDWTAYERQQAAAALSEYSKFSLLTFEEVSSRAAADFVLGKGFLDSGLSGKMGPPDPALGQLQGEGWFNTNPTFWSDAAGGLLAPGAYGYSNFIHEFGHGLGLAHPHDNGGGNGQLFEGVRSSSDTGEFSLNQEVFTVMSYNKGWADGPVGGSGTLEYGISRTPMAFDIAVIQQKYGANTSFANGDDSYALTDTNASGTGYTAIWDTSGADVIRHDGSAKAVIDLRAATLLQEDGGGGFVSYVEGVYGGLTIANGVVIEHGTGGTGDDVLTGNAMANRLEGRAGNDSLLGREGNDTLLGGDGTDTLNGGNGNDVIQGGETEADLRDVVYGGNGNDNIDGGYGNDELRGDAGDDTVSGGFGVDTIVGGTGNDVLTGQAWSDLIFGGAGGDFVNGGFGYDRVNGGEGGDRFYHLGVADHGSDWIQDYDAAQGDVLVYGGGVGAATADDFLVQTAETANAGVAGVQEAFITHIPSGNLLWALVDGDGQGGINLQIGDQVFDLLA